MPNDFISSQSSDSNHPTLEQVDQVNLGGRTATSNESQFQSSPPPSTKNVVAMVTEILDKLPPLPENWKELFIKWYPWVLIIGALLALPWVLVALGLASISSALTLGSLWAFVPGGRRAGISLVISIVDVAISFVGGLQMRSMKKLGWKLAIASEGLSILTSLDGASLLGLLVPLVSIYFLWQVKERYA